VPKDPKAVLTKVQQTNEVVEAEKEEVQNKDVD
jgi:hypothetical protein